MPEETDEPSSERHEEIVEGLLDLQRKLREQPEPSSASGGLEEPSKRGQMPHAPSREQMREQLAARAAARTPIEKIQAPEHLDPAVESDVRLEPKPESPHEPKPKATRSAKREKRRVAVRERRGRIVDLTVVEASPPDPAAVAEPLVVEPEEPSVVDAHESPAEDEMPHAPPLELASWWGAIDRRSPGERLAEEVAAELGVEPAIDVRDGAEPSVSWEPEPQPLSEASNDIDPRLARLEHHLDSVLDELHGEQSRSAELARLLEERLRRINELLSGHDR